MREMEYVVNKQFVWQRLKDETLIFNGNKAILLTLNETASFIAYALKKKKPSKKIQEELCKIYGISEKRAKRDLENATKLLLKYEIIVRKKT